MIRSFNHKGLRKFYESGSKAGIIPSHASKLEEQLSALDAAVDAGNMDLPGWEFHALKGTLAGHFAVSVNGNWRLTFRFEEGEAEVVDYQDYH